MSGTVHPLFPHAEQSAAQGPESERPLRTRDAKSDSDAALIARVARGDSDAHRALFERYHARVTSFVRRRLHDAGLCEEVVSDVFFEIWRSAAAYRGESEVPSWIFGIAHFKALSARRFHAQRKRSAVVPTADEVLERVPDGAVDADFEAREEVRRVLQAMQGLPEGHRDVLKLAFLEGRSYQEISDALGISEGNVKTRINRARTRLRAVMGRERGDA
jgi:RNA polymerase sigma-70 factor (ECF subfamily)